MEKEDKNTDSVCPFIPNKLNDLFFSHLSDIYVSIDF
jgi:hypothetical protein